MLQFDVTVQGGFQFAAVGDGRANDTPAFQERITAASTPAGGCVHIPPGSYRIESTLLVPSGVLALSGCGSSSHLGWHFDGPLFTWTGRCLGARIADFKVTKGVPRVAAGLPISPQHAAFDMSHGASDVSFERLEIRIADTGNVTRLPPRWGSGIRIAADGIAKPSDGGSIYFTDLRFFHFSGTAVELADVTHVVMRGCRFAAVSRHVPASTGLLLAGNTGGVCVEHCDFSELGTAIRVHRGRVRLGSARSELHGQALRAWNRELFATAAIVDGCLEGLVVDDGTFVSLANCWLASCDQANLLVTKDARPTLEIAGGIVFNAGTHVALEARPFSHHGAVIRSGSLSMSGVTVKNNAGIGLTVGPDVDAYSVTGCAFVDNWTLGAELGGRVGAFSGNVLSGNGGIGQWMHVGGQLQAAANAAANPVQR